MDISKNKNENINNSINVSENEGLNKIMAIIESGEVCRCTPAIAKRSPMPPGTSQVHTFQDSLPQTCFLVPKKLRFRREAHGVPSHLHTIQRAAHLN